MSSSVSDLGGEGELKGISDYIVLEVTLRIIRTGTIRLGEL